MKYRPLVVLGSCALAFGLVAGCSAKPAVSGAGSSASSASSSASPSKSAGEVIDAMMKEIPRGDQHEERKTKKTIPKTKK